MDMDALFGQIAAEVRKLRLLPRHDQPHGTNNPGFYMPFKTQLDIATRTGLSIREHYEINAYDKSRIVDGICGPMESFELSYGVRVDAFCNSKTKTGRVILHRGGVHYKTFKIGADKVAQLKLQKTLEKA